MVDFSFYSFFFLIDDESFSFMLFAKRSEIIIEKTIKLAYFIYSTFENNYLVFHALQERKICLKTYLRKVLFKKKNVC